LTSRPVQSDPASFQDCPWLLVDDPRDCDRSVVDSAVSRSKGHQKAIKKPPYREKRGLKLRRSPSPGRRAKNSAFWLPTLKNPPDLVGFL